MKRDHFAGAGKMVLVALLPLAACATPPATYPPRADVEAIVTPKPKPPAAILTDPKASDLHNDAVETWGDTISAAGARLCRFFQRTGVIGLPCPSAETEK